MAVCVGRARRTANSSWLAATRFDVFVTVDQSLTYQQDIRRLKIAVVTLVAQSNEIDALRPLVPLLRQVLSKVRPGQIIQVAA